MTEVNFSTSESGKRTLKIIWQKFAVLDAFTKSLIVCLLLLLVAVPFVASRKLHDTRQQAAEKASQAQQTNRPEFLSNQLLIKVSKEARNTVKEGNPSDTGIASLNAINKQFHVKKFERIAKAGKNSDTNAELFGWYIVTLDEPAKKIAGKLDEAIGGIKSNAPAAIALQQVIARYKANPSVQTVSLNYIVHNQAIPNDPYYSSSTLWTTYPDLWGMQKINAAAAWDQATGSTNIIVADVDTGQDRNNPDLAANMYVNTKEIPGNGIDDDGNGYVDDYYGCNFIGMSSSGSRVCGDPMDDAGHGTHTAGTIGAVGNNSTGVVGVNWTTRIMSLKFLDANGSGNIADGILALQYAADNGARVSSNSWGGNFTFSALDDAVKYEHDRGMVIVAAAGNNNIDALDFTPASSDYTITVAATNHLDAKSCFSNWGQKIDVAAPGGDLSGSCGGIDDYILSTRSSLSSWTAIGPNGNYAVARGTSMATPHVAGLAALLLSKNPSLTNEDVRQIIRNGADDLGSPGKDLSFGYGRINAGNSMAMSANHVLAPVITSPASRTLVSAPSLQVTGSIPGPNFASYTVEVGIGRTPTSWTTITTSSTQVINGTLATINTTTQMAEGYNIIRVTAYDTAGKPYQYQVNDVTIDNIDTSISLPVGLVSKGLITVTGLAQTKNGLGFGNFKLEWGQGSAPASWSTAGITLTNGGTQPVVNGTLGTWDTTALTNNLQYTIRLTVTSTLGTTDSYSVTVNVDADIVPGWPKTVNAVDKTLCQPCTSSTVTFADLDGDGQQEVIVTSPSEKLYVFRKDGSNFPGFPISIPSGQYFEMPPNVTDLDNNGKKEILVSAVTNWTGINQQQQLYIVRSDGTFYPGWPNPIFTLSVYAGYADATPVVADLDGDGKKELIIIDPASQKMHAYHTDGTEMAGFPKTLPFSYIPTLIPLTPTVADLNHDGKLEIIYGYGNKIYVFDNQGNLLPGWPYTAPANLVSGRDAEFAGSAGVGDIDGDGNLEIFDVDYAGHSSYDARVFGLKMDGTSLPNWPITVPGSMVGYFLAGNYQPTAADINGDGKDEIMVELGFLTMFNLQGIMPLPQQIPANIAAPLSDIEGNGKIDILAQDRFVANIVKGDGTVYWSKNLSTTRFQSTSGVLADIDKNGRMEMALADDRGIFNISPFVYMWELPATAAPAKYEWPIFGQNPARTGRLVVGSQPSPSPVSSPTLTPTVSTSPSSSVSPSLSPSPTPSDTTKPTVVITNPVNGATITKNTQITITANASDNVGVSKVVFTVNGATQCTILSSFSPYTCQWKVPGKPNATYTLTATASDAAGNAASSSVTIKSK